jgi:hypothetical protein
VGGGSAAGKTMASRTIAMRYDLAWYRVDGYAYEHQDRLIAKGLIDKPDDDYDRRFLVPTAEELADQFWKRAESTVPLVVDDLRGMDSGVGVVIEGPQLFPALVEPYLAGPGSGLWLVSTGQFQRQVLQSRLGDPSGLTSDAQRALDKRIRRNELLNNWTVAQAEASGLTVFEVDGSEDPPVMTARVVAHFAEALSTLPTARTGERRRELRQRENDATVRNVYAYLTEVGQAAGWRVPFTCECEHLGCDAVTGLMPDEYEQARAAACPIIAHGATGTAGNRR